MLKDDLEALVAKMDAGGIIYGEAVREFKKRYILQVLKRCKGNQFRAADELGIHRNTLARDIRVLKIDISECGDGYRNQHRRRTKPEKKRRRLVARPVPATLPPIQRLVPQQPRHNIEVLPPVAPPNAGPLERKQTDMRARNLQMQQSFTAPWVKPVQKVDGRA